ncbi:MAG TPA: NTF2-like N-terminal transpeptidase domain-containing protein [Thermomicrobiaceae bacterium]|nr:NTF2-like N-terminal transpeptidase domain-containing protein [Thermomicrobiaceae bacterium]
MIGFAASSQDPATAAQQAAHAFLTAWTSGDITQAADYTDGPAPALAALNAFRSDLRPEAISASTRQSTASGLVTYTVTVRLARPAPPSATTPGTASTGAAASFTAWTYNTQLRAYAKAGRWYVQWQPSVLAPGLTAAAHLHAVPIPPPPGPVTDAAGGDLSNSSDPGVSYIAALLAKNPPPGQGTPGLQIEIQTADGTLAAGTTPTLVAAPGPASTVRTTIQPAIEAASQSAADMYQRSAMVVIQPSGLATGYLFNAIL